MPTYRKLHVKAVDSLDINEMPDDFTRLLWVMLPLGLDSSGRGLDNASWVKARVMPLREDVSQSTIEDAMNWYAAHGMIRRYKANGHNYFDVPTWTKHQGDTSKEAKSHFPAYTEEAQEESVYSRPTPDLLQTNSNQPASTCASTCVSASEYTAEAVLAFGDNGAMRAQRLYQRVTGQNSIPSSAYDKAVADLTAVLDYYAGRDPPVEEGKAVFVRWCSTIGQKGKPYSRTNPGWIGWWLEELAPVPVETRERDTSQLSDAEFRAMLQKGAKDE